MVRFGSVGYLKLADDAVRYTSHGCVLCPGNNLTGTLPSTLTQSTLPYLNGIFLDCNSLTGTIPSAVFKFTSLVTLRLVRLLSYMLNMSLATAAILYANQCAAKLSLQDKQGQNKLSGTLYSSIAPMVNLVTLRVPDNQLTGAISLLCH